MDKLKWFRFPGLLLSLTIILALLMRLGIKPESNKWYGILYASDYFPPLNGFPNAADADELNSICSDIGKKYPFKMSTLHPGHKSFYGLPGSRYALITVYGVIAPGQQQRIIEIAKRVRSEEKSRSFVIEFYAEETGPSPHEQFLRKVRID